MTSVLYVFFRYSDEEDENTLTNAIHDEFGITPLMTGSYNDPDQHWLKYHIEKNQKVDIAKLMSKPYIHHLECYPLFLK